MQTKPLVWVGSTRDDLSSFGAPARREAGHDPWLVQSGRLPRDWRPMPDVGPGVVEIRVHTEAEHRVFYVARFEEAVYVLHAFEKRSRKTSRRDLETSRRRYARVIAQRGATSRGR